MGNISLCSVLEKVKDIQKKGENNSFTEVIERQTCFEEKNRSQNYREEVDGRRKVTHR